MVFSSAFNQNWTNMEHKHQYSINGSTYYTRFWKRTLLKPKPKPNAKPLQIPKQVLEGQKAVCGNRLVEQCTSAPQGDRQPTAASPVRCQAQELTVLQVQISVRTIAKSENCSGRVQEETERNTEVWQNSGYFKTSKLSKGQVHPQLYLRGKPSLFPCWSCPATYPNRREFSFSNLLPVGGNSLGRAIQQILIGNCNTPGEMISYQM